MTNAMSLKAQINNISKTKNISAQSVLQNYLMSRFLFRLSKSEYKDKFVIKGGMLIATIIGIEQRTTMDLDTTLKNLPLTKESIEEAFHKICTISTDDGINFSYGNIKPIRNDDEYGGYRVTFYAQYGKINAPMSMDVSTGDIITPDAEKHIFKDTLDENITFELLSYTVETVLAEKLETILSRGTNNTRPRDFYDVYKLSLLSFDYKILKDAFISTATHRNSLEIIERYDDILKNILMDEIMKQRWDTYSKQMPYVTELVFEDLIYSVKELLVKILIS